VRVTKGTLSDINYETKIVKKICAQDGLLDIGND